jgi:hypothetical protein
VQFIDLDEETYAALGRPIPRAVFAEVVDALTASNRCRRRSQRLGGPATQRRALSSISQQDAERQEQRRRIDDMDGDGARHADCCATLGGSRIESRSELVRLAHLDG